MTEAKAPIGIEELEGGRLGVSFPFDLKDSFKNTFPSAKWNPVDKQWTVGKRVRKRLDQWVEINSDTAKEMNRADIFLRLERALSIVEEKANEGYLYAKMTDRCRSLGVNSHPELLSRLNTAIDLAKKNKLKNEQIRKEEWQAANAAKDAEMAKVRANRLLMLDQFRLPLEAPVRVRDRIVVIESYGKSFRVNEDTASVHGSLFLGHEGELCSYAYYRSATTEEIALLTQEEKKSIDRLEYHKRLEARLIAIRDSIKANGLRPTETQLPQGTALVDRRTIYGGGFWFVVGVSLIWYIENNGADGDDWSRNNVSTGGAGAIGWCVDFSESLLEGIQEIDRELEAR